MTAPNEAASPKHAAQLERINTTLEPKIKALIDAWGARGGSVETEPEPEPAYRPSAVEVRLGWYIPKRHRGDTFATFRVLHPSQKDALEATRAWVESVKAGEGGALALTGGVGTGKSHLLYAAIRELNESGIHAAAGGWYDLADIWRQAKAWDDEANEARVRKARILGASAIGIDEIRPTSGTDYDTTELAGMMTRAYRECQGIMVTSNYADEKLSRIVGLAASSRLTEITVVGPDLRKPENRHLRAVS